VRAEALGRCRREDRVSVAAVKSAAPIIVMYIHGIGGIDAEPKGAAATAPIACPPRRRRRVRRHRSVAGQVGPGWRLQATGPTPGRRRRAECRTSWQVEVRHVRAEVAQAASPTRAFRFAPSTYTWPPCACTISQSA
jgi:hypothetical protein